MPDRGRGTDGSPPSLGPEEQVAPVASALTALLTVTNRMMEKLDEQGSWIKGDKSSGTLRRQIVGYPRFRTVVFIHELQVIGTSIF
jgi:hypothetical protein